MKTFLFKISLIAVFCVLVFTACEKDEERLTAADAANITEEALVDTYFQDVDDLAAVAIASPSDADYAGGRTTGSIVIQDSRFCDGAVVTIEPDASSTSENPVGILTVDFGTTGCMDVKGNVRKGKLIFTYAGRRFVSGSTVITTTENYSINGIALEGTRTSTNITASPNDAPKFHVILENGKATFPDTRIAERQSDVTWSWIRGTSPGLDKVIVHSNSTASGTTRAGRTYEVSLLEQLEYQRYCGIAVSGIKKYVIDETKEITIGYGDGNCDTVITVTANGFTKTITLQ